LLVFVSEKIHTENATVKRHPLSPYTQLMQTLSALVTVAFAAEFTLPGTEIFLLVE